MLKDETDTWAKGQQDPSNLVSNYFSGIFQSAVSSEMLRLGIAPSAGDPFADQAHLAAPFEMIEVRRALLEMNPSKAPGPNGIQAHFFQFGWPAVKKSLLDLPNHLLPIPIDIKAINQTFISLIPKKDLVEHVPDFRPISICNNTYKLISMLIATI